MAPRLLINCLFSWDIWYGISRDFGLTLIVLADLGSLLGWRTSAMSSFGKRLWSLVPAAVCWAIRLERNNRVFRGQSEPAWKVYRRAKDSILFWARRCKGYEGISQGDLIRNWDCVIGSSWGERFLFSLRGLPSFFFSFWWGFLIPFLIILSLSLFNKKNFPIKKRKKISSVNLTIEAWAMEAYHTKLS